jgi:hypothetical protein
MMAKAVQHIADGYEVVIYGTEGSILVWAKEQRRD